MSHCLVSQQCQEKKTPITNNSITQTAIEREEREKAEKEERKGKEAKSLEKNDLTQSQQHHAFLLSSKGSCSRMQALQSRKQVLLLHKYLSTILVCLFNNSGLSLPQYALVAVAVIQLKHYCMFK